ncbi:MULTISPECIES: hypothetical protein [Streptacidiphilus]|uniref:Uncharacterized protein n=2 Tax=Streptacidiphilus TaxID=228398 RepID=A0ABV6UIE3_9ACTN|nr:hypothetical protein [Streptacidiphilus jeojiense]
MPEKLLDTEVICGVLHQDTANSDDAPADIAELHKAASIWCAVYIPPSI